MNKLYHLSLDYTNTEPRKLYLVRKYLNEDWVFSGRIRYTTLPEKETTIEFEIDRILDVEKMNIFKRIWVWFTTDDIPSWIDADILFEETEPYVPKIPSQVVVECDRINI